MSSQAENQTKKLSNEMIRLIARSLRNTSASRLKAVSKRFKDTVYAKSHPMPINNNGYRTNDWNAVNERGLFQYVNGKKRYKQNHIDFKAKSKRITTLQSSSGQKVRLASQKWGNSLSSSECKRLFQY